MHQRKMMKVALSRRVQGGSLGEKGAGGVWEVGVPVDEMESRIPKVTRSGEMTENYPILHSILQSKKSK